MAGVCMPKDKASPNGEQNDMLQKKCKQLVDALNDSYASNQNMDCCILTLDPIIQENAVLNTEDGKYYNGDAIEEYRKKVGKQPYYDVQKPLHKSHLYKTRTLGKKIKQWEDEIATLKDKVKYYESQHRAQKNKMDVWKNLVSKLEAKQINYKRRLKLMHQHIDRIQNELKNKTSE